MIDQEGQEMDATKMAGLDCVEPRGRRLEVLGEHLEQGACTVETGYHAVRGMCIPISSYRADIFHSEEVSTAPSRNVSIPS